MVRIKPQFLTAQQFTQLLIRAAHVNDTDHAITTAHVGNEFVGKE